MTFGSHIAEFADRPVVEVPLDGPLPTVTGPVSWSVSHPDFDDHSEDALSEAFAATFERFVAQAGPTVESLVIEGEHRKSSERRHVPCDHTQPPT
ncbi:hypothetical protein [Micromonospora craniellae]|uniref:Uncharacterized protein n=1 Tax=Micromonospora craniellae TaxID=2294034 RepID=A0A372G0P5_9ACTN|nr:hypothetical protein [Micromonospora craniellae]QOC91618.1 hypothetical protein ID554_27370 [Micromonospora craniellae]RFS46602.1 hypothetical protein D0Q02_10995 [Micromonospora craniellae]